MFLITGCGRSGTKYISRVLNQCGLDVGHEVPGKDGTVSSIWAVRDDRERYPVWHHQGPRPKFDVTLFQIRNPVHSIPSLTTGSIVSWRWNQRHIPLDLPDPDDEEARLLTAAQYWTRWNMLCLKKYGQPYQIENLEAEWPRICGLLDIRVPYTTAVRGISRQTNTRKHPVYSAAEIRSVCSKELWRNMTEMARVAGYEGVLDA